MEEQLEKVKELQAKLQKLEILNVPDEEEPPSLFTINGVEVIPKKATALIAAQKKSGKSNFAGLMMAASASTEHQMLNGAIRSNCGQINILYVDTEQPWRDARHTLRRCMKSAGYGYDEQWNQHGIKVYSVKDEEEQNRMLFIELAIKENKPDMVIIDGLADLIETINDEKDSKQLMAWMDAVANQFDCAVVGMLHLNFNNGKIGGWAGTQGYKKATDLFILKKDKKRGIFTVEHEGRGESAPDLSFKIFCPMDDKIGWWQSLNTGEIPNMTKEDAEKQALTELMAQAKLPCNNGQLVSWVMKTKNYTSKSPANRLLAKCKEYGILDSRKEGRNSIWFKVTKPDPNAEEQELPLSDD